MRRTLLRWSAPLLLALACWLPASAQAPQPTPPPSDADKAQRDPPAMQYVVAVLCSLLVLWIVCMPSRKG
jgi:hypothetical protein